MFTNYSQTYASAITTLAGLVVSLGAVYGYTFLAPQIEFVLGVCLNFGGIIWAVLHRNSKGDVNIVGFRK